MKSLTLLFLGLLSFHSVMAQNADLQKKEVEVGNTSFFYHVSSEKSDAIVLLFHDWFGVSDLSYEMADRIIDAGMDVIIMDLYKGKSATTNQEAGGLMNSMDQANMWGYIDAVLAAAGKNHDKIMLWGFSLGTIPASQTAIKNAESVDGLILFYGNVTQDKEQLKNITFPALMVMGAKDNPAGAINFFNNVNEASGSARLFIYPRARHAFAQKLFNGGANYDEQAKEASLGVAFQFLSEINN